MRSALILLFLASPLVLRAQFQQPTPDELKMTEDPKAPGAAAVYLNIEEITNDPLHFHSFYARIKVLQEKGKELATVDIPYERGNFKVNDIKGRTIHPDGTITPLQAKPEDLLVAKSGDLQFGKKVFTLPSVEVGSILEYRYDLGYDDNQFSSPLWTIQRPYFVHKAHYAFTPFKAFQKGADAQTSKYLEDEKGNVLNQLVWWTVLPPGVKLNVDSVGRYSLDVSDIPAIPDEEWMPPNQSVLYKTLFYYKSASSLQDFWVTEAKRWSKEVDHFAEPTKAIQQAVAGIVTPGQGDLDKATVLYRAVQALDNTDFTRQKGQAELKQLGLHAARRAEDTWAQKSGSSQDIALLYLAMLRAAGIPAYAMRVVNRDRSTFDPGFLYFDQLDDVIVLATLGGKEVALDPGEKMCPFETLRWTHAGAMGIRESPDARYAAISPSQSYKENTLLRSADITIDEHGVSSGSVSFVMTGQRALHWRQKALTNDLEEVKKQFDRELQASVPDGIEAHVDHFLALDLPASNLIAIVKVNGSLGVATSKRLILPGFFFETRGSHPFVNQEKRLEPVDMRYAEQVTDQVVYHLPAGLVVEGAPQATQVPWQGHAVLATKTVTAPGQVTIVRQLSRAFAQVKADEYPNLRAFYQKVAAADQQQLVLTTAPAKDN